MTKATKKKETDVKEESKEVAAPETGGAVANIGIGDVFETDAGAGLEHMTTDDLAIPRIGIVQSLSPQRSKSKSEYIEGCEEGQIFDNVSKTIWDGNEGITVVPIQYQTVYLEWAPRDSGKGLVANYGRDSTEYDKAKDTGGKRIIERDGQKNVIEKVGEYYVYLINDDGSMKRAVLSMSATMLKHAKRWNSMITETQIKNPKTGQMAVAPIYWNAYRLKTVPESNNQGEWFRWEIKIEGPLLKVKDDGSYDEVFKNGAEIFRNAREFRKAVMEDNVKVAEPHQENDAADDESF